MQRLSPVDLVIVEGFKREPHRKIEVHRAEVGKPPLHPGDASIVAIAADAAFPAAGRPVVDLDDVEAVAGLALAFAEPIGDVLAKLNGDRPRHGAAHG